MTGPATPVVEVTDAHVSLGGTEVLHGIDLRIDPATGQVMSPAQRAREVVEEVVLADQVGLDVYGLGEHHRPDFVASAPAVLLAAAASRTERIRLTSAVTVLSSDDPVRVFQDFATLDLVSKGLSAYL